MYFKKEISNIFSDKSSKVLRVMLKDPKRKWKTRDFINNNISSGLVSLVLNKAEDYGYINRIYKGKNSYSVLSDKETLLNEWKSFYRFDKNPSIYFHHNDKYFLKNCVSVLKEIKINYSLTLYSASKLISPYVKDESEYIYIDIKKDEAKDVIKTLRDRLLLNKLAKGGNVCFAIPFYKESVFSESRKIGNYNVVSNLQLYLDLINYPPVGIEEAEHLVEHWKKRGEEIA